MGWLDGSDWSFLTDNGGTSVSGGQSGFSGGSFLGGDSGGGFSSFFGGGGDSGGTNWTGLLASGLSSFAAGKNASKNSKQQHKYDLENIAAAADAQRKLYEAKAAEDEKYYQLHGQQLKDAFGAYSDGHGQAQRPVGLLSGYAPLGGSYGGY